MKARALTLIALAAFAGCASKGKVAHHGPDDVVLQSHIHQLPAAAPASRKPWARLPRLFRPRDTPTAGVSYAR